MTASAQHAMNASVRWCLTDGDPAATVVGYTVLARHSPCIDHLPPVAQMPAEFPAQPVDAGNCELCATDHRVVLLHLQPRATVLGMYWVAGTIAVPDDLIGKTLADARHRLRELDIAYIRQLLDARD